MGHNLPMPGIEIDLNITQRAKFDYEFFVNDGLNPPNAVDISNRVFTSQMRSLPCGPLVATFTFTPEDQTTSDGKGRVIMSLASSVTEKIPPGEYVYDVFQKIGTDDPDVVFFGKINVKAAVTR